MVGSARQSFASRAKSSAQKFFSYSKASKTIDQRQQQRDQDQVTAKPTPPVSYTPVKLEDPEISQQVEHLPEQNGTSVEESSKSFEHSVVSRKAAAAAAAHAAAIKSKATATTSGGGSSSSGSLHQSRYQSHVDGTSKAIAASAFDSSEADQYIEQLMREAETDPKLRELTYGKPASMEPAPPPIPPAPVPSALPGSPRKPPRPASPQKPALNESYPSVQRPYRTAQDMVIRDGSPETPPSRPSRPSERPSKMEKRPYRTNEDLRIEAGGGGGSFEERSKSADGRLNAGFKRRDPKLSQFRSSSAASTENLAAAGAHLLNEVVTDQVTLTFVITLYIFNFLSFKTQ